MQIAQHRIVGARFHTSPNQSPRANERKAIVVHYTAGHTLEGAERKLTAPRSATNPSPASAHVIIARDGALVQLVAFNRVAWHAGPSKWRGRTKLNDWSIGIELVNAGPLHPAREHMSDPDVCMHQVEEESGVVRYDAWQAYPEPQLAALEQLVAALREAYPSIAELVGHEHICVPRGRKQDPGPAFDWQRFGGVPPQAVG